MDDTLLGESPSKKRRVPGLQQLQDDDATPRRLHGRPLLRPISPVKHTRRSPSPTAIKSLPDLKYLEKPVSIVPAQKAFSTLPTNVKDLFKSVQRVGLHSEFVPAEIQDDISILLSDVGIDTRESWFIPSPPAASDTDTTSRKEELLSELVALLDIGEKAAISSQLGRHEAAWNSVVHQPLLELAFEEDRGARIRERLNRRDKAAEPRLARVRVENVSSATISGECVPRLSRQDGDTASLGAWSVSQSSAGSTASTEEEPDPFFTPKLFPLDSTVHSKAGSKKVDFAIVLEPEPGSSFHTIIQTILARLTWAPSLSRSVNPSTYGPLIRAPMAIVIETKTVTAARDPLIQLSLMAAAFHRRLHTLPVGRATGGSPLTETGELVTLPLIAITNHRWELFFACDRGGHIVRLTYPTVQLPIKTNR